MTIFGGIAGFQLVPRSDPLPTASMAIQLNVGGTTVTLSWPTGLGEVVLQESVDLQAWTPSSPQPATTSIVVPVQAGSRFFRLARP